VGVSVVVGGIADRDAPRNSSLKRLIVQKHGERMSGHCCHRTSNVVAGLDIAAGLPERESCTKCALKTASGETLPILKEAFMTSTLWQRQLKIWVFVTNITYRFILGLDVL
jgi:hypothetical protein